MNVSPIGQNWPAQPLHDDLKQKLVQELDDYRQEISQLADRRVENVKDVVSVGDVVRVKITNIDEQNQKISLSIREALRDEEDED